MDKAPGFDAEEFEAWLRKQPREVDLVIAIRMALRVTPLYACILDLSHWTATLLAKAIVLPILRGMALPWVGHPTEPIDWGIASILFAVGEVTRAAATARDAASEARAVAKMARGGGAAATATTAFNARRAATAAAIVADAARAGVLSPKTKISLSSGALVAADTEAFAADRAAIDAGSSFVSLAAAPLWPDGGMPDDLRKDWERLKSALLSLNEDWDVWTDWYEARLEGAEANEALEVARVTLPEALWQQGPKAVNGEIRHLIELSQKGGDEAVHARMADLRRQYPGEGQTTTEARADAGKIEAKGFVGTASVDPGPAVQSGSLRVWMLQYKPEEGGSDWVANVRAGEGLSWKSTQKAPLAEIKAGDPVIFRRTILGKDKGGIVGSGLIASNDIDEEDGTFWFQTHVVEFFDDDPIPFDRVKKEAMSDRGFWQGAVLRLKPEEAAGVNALLKDVGRKQLAGFGEEEKDATTDRHETDFVSDRPETARDLLGRAPLAFALAAHINRIWSAQVSDEEEKGRWRRCLDACHLHWLSRQPRRRDEAAFILHIDAPWGGGKTTFANFLARILNPHGHGLDPAEADQSEDALLKDLPLDDARYWPEEFKKRRWYVVNFNAWQHEHVAPPWWNFYEAIRRQCARAILFEPGRDPHPPEGLVRFGRALDWIWPESLRPRGWLLRLPKWLWFSARELFWRIFRPAMRNTVLVLVIVGSVGYWAMHTDWFATLLAAGGTPSETEKAVFKALFGVAATGGVGYFLLNAFRSGLQAVVESAGASADAARFGESDPLERFREHFSWFVEQLDEPVLVVVDDLDRCEPKYVVELVRGMLTFFRSPRVVFLLLGDKDWIETAFAKVHKDMAEVHRDSQITFGGRFAEKAIQLSFILPEADPASRNAYLTALLAPDEPSGAKKPVSEEAVSELKAFESEVRTSFAGTDRVAEQNAAFETEKSRLDERFKAGGSKERQELRQAAEAILNREAMLRAATARSAEAEIRRHALEPLKAFLPPNPRRIKRIVNMIGAYQASARSAEGVEPLSDQWRQLVLWTVVMSEYPNVWRTLVVYPALAARIIAGVGEADENGHVALKSPGEKATERERSNYTLLSRALGEPNLVRLMRGDPFAGDGKRGPKPPALDADALQWLRRLTPLD